MEITSSKLIEMVKEGYNQPSNWPELTIRLYNLIGSLLLNEDWFQKTTTMHANVNFATKTVWNSINGCHLECEMAWNAENVGYCLVWLSIRKKSNLLDRIEWRRTGGWVSVSADWCRPLSYATAPGRCLGSLISRTNQNKQGHEAVCLLVCHHQTGLFVILRWLWILLQ